MEPSSILVWDLVQLYSTLWLMRTALSQGNTAVMKATFHGNLTNTQQWEKMGSIHPRGDTECTVAEQSPPGLRGRNTVTPD